MRAPGDVLLVSCYELGHQPLSLASPLAALAEAGFQPLACDAAVEPLDEAAVRRAKLVAISAPMHTALRVGQDVAGRVRQLSPGAHLCFYGLYAWLNAEHLFEASLADSAIGGEFEQPLVDLARWLEAVAPSPAAAGEGRGEGTWLSRVDHPHPSPLAPAEEGIVPAGVRFPKRYAPPSLARHSWQVPQRAGLPSLKHYAHLVRDGHTVPAGYVEATRGCKHTCSHCPITPIYHGRFFAVPREIVLADARAQIRAGARHITFGDPDFLNGPTHSLKIARALDAEFPDVTFDATIKIEHILRHAAVLPELRELGCLFVVSAVESLSDTVLSHLKKGHTAADVDRALDVMASAGIPLRPSLVAFTPWTSLDDYVHMLAFVRSRELVDCIDPVQYAIRLLIPPGSALLEDAGSWLGELDRAAFSYRWTHPDPRMDALHAQVGGIVECGELEHREVWDTFRAIELAAHRVAGLPLPLERRRTKPRPPPPRLTESWFC